MNSLIAKQNLFSDTEETKTIHLIMAPLQVSAIMRHATCGLKTSINYARSISTATHYLPLYSTHNSFTQNRSYNKNQPISRLCKQQLHLANTTSGSFVPSSVASKSEPQGNLDVFECSDHLPSLPVPSLTETLEKLKESISPLAMNSAEFASTLQLIENFSKSAGPKLDLLLRNKANQTKNWLTHDWWTREIYLKSRKPLVINSNPAMIYPTLPFDVSNQRSLVSVTARIVSGVIDFNLALLHGYNPEATSADTECSLDPNYCYNQYKNIFGSTRLPNQKLDEVKVKHLTDDLSSIIPFNIVISHRGKFFEVQLQDLENEEGRIDQLEGIINKIISIGQDTVDTELGVGVMTTANRDDWAQKIKLLDEDSLAAIKDSQFLLCIDNIASDESSDDFLNALITSPIGSTAHSAALGRQVLHADGANVGNRWFDKAIQLIVVADDKSERLLGAGINYEHSFAEGMVVTKMIEYSYDKTIQSHRASLQSAKSSNRFNKQQYSPSEPASFRQLRMYDEGLEGQLVEHLKQAKQDFLSQVAQFDLSLMSYRQYGSNAIKSWHFSPDSWFQVALLSAYHKVHKRLGPCYESASTRRFAFGRTETIRSLTKEVAQFCFEPSFDTMKAAVKSHKSYAISANRGDAIDRALFGYRMTFNELKSDKWLWGLPTSSLGHNVDHILNLSSSILGSKQQLLNRSDTNSQQGFSIDDLFTEEELGTVSAFFNNELIKRSIRFALSTSQVSSSHPNIYMSYGPLLADGYGCCYNITGQQIVAAITANSSNQSFSCEAEKLNQSIKSELEYMRDLVEEQHSKRGII